MFIGTYEHTLDTKNRLIIPAKFRNQLGDKVVITNWMEQSLHAFTQEGWEQFMAEISAMKSTRKEVRQFQRFIIGGATDAEFDKTGRVSIPGNLKEYARLEKNVVIIGTGENSFEIWDADEFKAYNEATAEDFDEIAENLDFDF